MIRKRNRNQPGLPSRKTLRGVSFSSKTKARLKGPMSKGGPGADHS